MQYFIHELDPPLGWILLYSGFDSREEAETMYRRLLQPNGPDVRLMDEKGIIAEWKDGTSVAPMDKSANILPQHTLDAIEADVARYREKRINRALRLLQKKGSGPRLSDPLWVRRGLIRNSLDMQADLAHRILNGEQPKALAAELGLKYTENFKGLFYPLLGKHYAHIAHIAPDREDAYFARPWLTKLEAALAYHEANGG